jgi:hypothetical protein
MTTTYSSKSTASYDSIKLGIDAHAQYYWVSRQVDGATPQPVQKMTCDELMLFVVKQQKLTRNVVTCYEAGAFGFPLHRRFEELGIKNYWCNPRTGMNVAKGSRMTGSIPQRCASVWIVLSVETERRSARCVFRRWTKSGNARLAVDLWRVFTGQVEAEKFGLVHLPEAA